MSKGKSALGDVEKAVGRDYTARFGRGAKPENEVIDQSSRELLFLSRGGKLSGFSSRIFDFTRRSFSIEFCAIRIESRKQ